MQSNTSDLLSPELECLADEVLDFFGDDFEFSDEDEAAYDDSEEVFIKTEAVSSAPVTDEGTSADALTTLPARTKSKVTRKYPDVLKEEQISKMRKNHKRLTLQQSKQGREVLSRSVCNSIHSAYPLMFMNTINSSDLAMVQNYFAAFMSGPCTFLVRQKINRQYGLPNALSAFGPQLFTHYLLGCFVSFPDMAIKMRDSRAISSGGRTRIVIDVTVCGTKIFDIPEYEWAPDVERMPELYQSHSGATSPSHSSSDSGSDSSVCSEERRTPPGKTTKEAVEHKEGDTTDLTTTAGDEKKKKKKSKSKIKLPMIMPSAENVAAAQRVPRIPKEYVTATVEHARMLPAPQPLFTLGSITLFLDEHNCMQHVLIDLEERNATTAQAVLTDGDQMIPINLDSMTEDALDRFIEDFDDEEYMYSSFGGDDFNSTASVPPGETDDSTTSSTITPVAAPEMKSKPKKEVVDILREERVSKLRKVHHRLCTLQSQQAERKEGLPRSIRNSIHSAYPLMLMNAINSSDLPMIQSYFGAFMAGPCTFMVSLKADRHYGLPKALCAFGPQLFTHYLLGCFVSFPDMAVRMRDSRTNYINGRARIVIDVTVCGTKILDIPQYEWAPHLQRMTDLYSNPGESGATTLTTPTPVSSASESDSSASQEDKTAPASPVAAAAQEPEEPEQEHDAAELTVPTSQETTRKKKKNKIRLPMIMPSAENVAAAQRVPRIPHEYVMATVQHARMLTAPKVLQTVGTMTLFLDQHNCIQHLQIDVEQDRSVPADQKGV